LTACEVNPLVHLQLSTSDLAVKHQFIEVDKSQYLRQELNSKKAQIQLAEQRHNEKLHQSQEAQQQEIASLQTHVSEQNTLVEARYAEQLWQSKQAFQQELLQKEISGKERGNVTEIVARFAAERGGHVARA